jgi:CHAD domain-containing protein
MLTRAQQKKLLAKMVKSLERHLLQFREDQSFEALHRYRVKSKRIRTLVELIQAERPGAHIMAKAKPMDKLFKMVGEIRTAQVNHALLMALGFDEASIRQDQCELLALTRQFCHDFPVQLKKLKSAAASIQKHLKPIQDKVILRYCEEKLDLSVQFFTASVHHAALHDSRKNLRHLQSAVKLLQPASRKRLGINEQYLSEILQNIGEWHDLVVFAQMYKSINLEHPQQLLLLQTIMQKKKTIMESCISNFENRIFEQPNR